MGGGTVSLGASEVWGVGGEGGLGGGGGPLCPWERLKYGE